jgi:hypothetical protein
MEICRPASIKNKGRFANRSVIDGIEGAQQNPSAMGGSEDDAYMRRHGQCSTEPA